MNIETFDEDQTEARPDPIEHPLLTALDADADVYDLHGASLEESTVTEKIRNALQHCLVIVSLAPQNHPPEEWEEYLREGMDSYPGVRTGGVDYAYWSTPAEHPEFAIAAWAKEPNQSMPLTIRERLVWEVGMRLAFKDQRSFEELLLAVAEKGIVTGWNNPPTDCTDSPSS